MKNDPERGAEDLETFGLMFKAIGSIFYCIFGGLIMRRDGHETSPKNYFLISSFVGAAIFLAALFYPKQSE